MGGHAAMMSGGGDGVRRGDLLRLFDGASAAGLGDGELLGRFVARRDDAAFEALVARLGPLVLGACRRMLADPHDVEDAFQATFLVLVRGAGSIRDRDAVATWLYGVAVRVARRARADSARRADRERRAAVAEAGEEPEPRLERSEACARIDEEIGRLPESHRRLIVLCDLEGLSREEAAARLGWTANMVRGRLERARARLRDRLARRGLSSAGAWPVLAMPPAAPGVALVAATVRGAVGRPAVGPGSASALSLSEGVIRMMMLARWKLAASVVASVGVATALAAIAAVPAAGARPAPARAGAPAQVKGPATRPAGRRLPDLNDPPSSGPFFTSKPRRDPDEPRPSMEGAPEAVPVRVSGLVRDLDERPVAGATVLVVATQILDVPRLKIDETVAGTATTGADGRYAFPAALIPTSRDRHTPQALTPYVQFHVVARAAGFGIGWPQGESMYALPRVDPKDIQGRTALGSPATMDVYLRPEAALRGRVIDEAGRPVAGVKVEVAEVDLRDERGMETTVRLPLNPGVMPGGLGRASTDADGRFRLPGLPSESCCWLFFDRPGSNARQALYASTSAGAEIKHPPPTPPNGRGQHVASPAEMTVTMATPRRLDVRVVASDDGRPVPDIRVISTGESPTTGPFSSGTTDAEGKVALDLPAGAYPGLEAGPASADSRFVGTVLRPLVVAPEPAVQPIDFRMKAGAEVMIEVVDAETGRGIPDVRFDIKPGRRGTGWDRLQKPASYSHEASTDAAGKVRAVLDPRPGAVYRVRVLGVGPEGPAAPDGPNVAPAPPAPVAESKKLPYIAVRAESDPFEPRPGVPTTLRFTLRKK